MSGAIPLSVLDVAPVGSGDTASGAIGRIEDLARLADRHGYHRFWLAEHHGMPSIATASPEILIHHVASRTERIRVGAGGIMLPNHAPLVIAEQFGTLAELHPGRIDLGLGRAPGTDQLTFQALRRDPRSAERFPSDVLELQGYLADESRIPGVQATPGKGTYVPLYILGSSLFGARLAAAFGLPYAFASHFAPAALEEAVATYRREFQPSTQLDTPHVIAGINVIATDTGDEAEEQFLHAKRRRAKLLFGRRDRRLSTEEADVILASPAGAQVLEMVRYSAVGTPELVARELDRFAEHARADELILASPAPSKRQRLRTFELVAQARGLASAA